VDFARAGLTVKKAWFLFDEGMVALGAGITSTADVPVRTTINQCHWRTPAFLEGQDEPLTAGTYPLMPETAFRQDGVTYRILDGHGTLTLSPQSGAWSDCGVGSTERKTLNVLNAGLDHGTRPNGASYAYAVLPDAPDVFTDDPARFIIVRNDTALQAVWHVGDRRGHAVFYAPGAVTFPDGQCIAVERPCIVLYHPGPATVFTVAQPEGGEGLLTLNLSGPVTANLGVSLPTAEYAGACQTLVWQGK
jgi:chondroitin AC lyase